jgi:hypothetical protein
VPENEAHRPPVMARVAAVVALLALVAAIGLILLGVVRHFLAVLAGLVALVACVMAGWYVVSKPLDLRFNGPDGYYPTAHLILVSNDPYQMDHIGNMGTRRRLDLGVLGIVATRIADAAQASRFVALEAAGRIRRFPGWLEWRSPKFVVGSGGPLQIGIDGEALQMDPPLVFESLPAALRVRVPCRAVQPSRRARAVRLLSASTIAELARVVAGSYG